MVADEATLVLEIARRFDASPERVFDAWLDKEWAAWLPPANGEAEVVRLEPVEGGRYLVVMRMADGRKIEISGAYRKIERPTRLVFTWVGHNKQETLITVTFHKSGRGTLMTFRQEGFKDSALRDRVKAGWTDIGGSFDKLERMLLH